jgi:hypothetical protein
MKTSICSFILLLICASATCQETVYVGSTPAHRAVREFLGISQNDSIDFIRWKLVIRADSFEALCSYGIGKPGTKGFQNEKRTNFSGTFKKAGHRFYLSHGDKTFSMLEVNPAIVHLLDEKQRLLTGNGGFSYTLNTDKPYKSNHVNLQFKESRIENEMLFHGRTPCTELSAMIGAQQGSDCEKLKWYLELHTDPASGAPSYFEIQGTPYRQQGKVTGKWERIQRDDGNVLYKLTPERQSYSLYLLRADENVLFFTDAEGNLLVGNEDFSYTLNRRKTKITPR